MRISDWSSDVCSSDLDQGGRSAAISRDKHMNKFVVAGLLAGTLFGGAALAAQTAPAPDAQPRVQRTMPKIDTDGSGTIGRAEMLAAARSEEHTSELQSLMRISYAVFCLKKHKNTN